MKYPFHPLSEIFPLLHGAPLEELVADVRENGVREPVWLYQGQILDGRNRYRAAELAGREALTREYTGEDPLKFVISMNLHRRHLDESQRGMVAVRIANLKEGRPSSEAASKGAVSQTEAAQIMKVGRSTVQRARKVVEKAAPEVVEAVDRGELRVDAAADIVEAPKQEQVAALREGKAAVKQLRKKIKASRAPSTPHLDQEALLRRAREEAVQHLSEFARAVEAKRLTPKDLIAALPLWVCARDGALMKFMAKCAALATKRRQQNERQHAAWRKKWQKVQRATAAKAEKKKRANLAAAKKTAAKKVGAKRAHPEKRSRTAARHAVRKTARRSGDTKQRRSAKLGRDARVSRRLSHPSVSA